MPIALTEEHRALAEAVEGFVTRHAPIARARETFDALAEGALPDHWPALVAQGLHAVHLPEEHGGQGGGPVELAVVAEAAGHGLLAGPLLPTVQAGAVVALAAKGEAWTTLMGELAAGATAALVLPGEGLTGEATADGWTVSGRTVPVTGLLSAQVLVVGVPVGGQTVWLRLDPGAVGIEQEEGVDLTRDVGRLTVDGLAVGRGAEIGPIEADEARAVVTTVRAAEAAGLMRWAVGATTEYAKVREQFGRPIGSFQAIKHKIARLFVAAELAGAATWDAASSLEQGADQRRLAVAGAAVVSLGAAVHACVEAITIFGGIGVTWEHDAHLYWRRAMSLAAQAGPTADWQIALGEAALGHRREVDLDLADAEPEFRAWVADRLDAMLALPESPPTRGWRTPAKGPRTDLLAEAGLVSPHWPRPYGLGATSVQQIIIGEEFARRGLTPLTTVIGEWALPTILAHGTPEQAERFARPTLRGELIWCQLFSEPGAGSDLAGLATRAVKVDGGWQLSGQKVWNSAAHRADWGICLARTDPAVRKHKGLSYFLVDMHSPGIDVRPLRQVTGEAEFNEVFLDDVFVPDECLVGEPGEGWRLATTTLSNERLSISSTMATGLDAPLLAILRNDAQATGRDEALRSLGGVRAYDTAISALGLRATLQRLSGQQPGAGTSVAKVATAQLTRDAADAALALLGPEAAVRSGVVDVADTQLHVPAQLIGGGTLEIQLNVVAERVLGLPRS